MTFSGLEILSIVILIIILLLMPIFVTNGWLGFIAKSISIAILTVLMAIGVYIAYQYYSTEDVPLNTIEAQAILDVQKKIYRDKSYKELLAIMHPNEPDTFEVVGKSGTTYQIEVSSTWVDRENKNEGLLVCLSIDNGFRSAYSPMIDSFIKTPKEH